MAFLKGKGFRMLFASFVITCVHQLVNSHWLDRWLFRPLASHRASIAGGYSGGYSGGNKIKILHTSLKRSLSPSRLKHTYFEEIQ